jgi:release factor glutamine methyltransferase
LKSLHDIFLEGRSRLNSLPEGELEARLLLYEALSISEEKFFADPDFIVTSQRKEEYFDLIQKRLSGIPTAYLTGKREFWSLSFDVGPGVLIPRPETELVVEKVLELTRAKEGGSGKGSGLMIADIGTGSGCIAISLAKELPESRVIATEISVAALTFARRNASALRVLNIEIYQGDLFQPLIDERVVSTSVRNEGADELIEGKSGLLAKGCDFIVSNPPYVSAAEWETLEREVREHEPREALVAGKSGPEIIAKLILEAPSFLKPGGHLIFEIGFGQKEAVLSLFGAEWRSVDCYDDLDGIPRTIVSKLA